MKKIQFGCGNHRLEGWENFDSDLDIRNPLPFTNNTIGYILAEHVVEHITPQQGFGFLDECHRILRPGGVARIIVPSVELLFERFTPAYGRFVEQRGWGDSSLRSAISALVFLHGHQAVWTAGSLLAIMSAIGFECERSEPDCSRHSHLNNIDGHGNLVGRDINRAEAVVIEGTKV